MQYAYLVPALMQRIQHTKTKHVYRWGSLSPVNNGFLVVVHLKASLHCSRSPSSYNQNMLASVRRLLQAPLLQATFLRSFSSAAAALRPQPHRMIASHLPRFPTAHLQQLQLDAPRSVVIGDPWINLIIQAMNRNNRKAKRANHGKRPCSRVGRRAKSSKYGNPRRS